MQNEVFSDGFESFTLIVEPIIRQFMLCRFIQMPNTHKRIK